MTKPPQARNAIKRAIAYVAGIRFSKPYMERCKQHFNNHCAYCDTPIEPGQRRGHLDHAIAMTIDSPHYHLVYACYLCNGDNKREENWKTFISKTCKDDEKLLTQRVRRIEQWFSTESPVQISTADLQVLRSAERKAIAFFNKCLEEIKKDLGRNDGDKPDQ